MSDTLTLPPDRRPLPWPQSTLPGYVGAPPPPPTPPPAPPPTPVAQPPTISGQNQPWTAAPPGQPAPSYGPTPQPPGPFVGTTSTQPTPGDYRPSVPRQVTAPWMPNSPGASFFGQPGNRSGPIWTWYAPPDDPSVVGKPLPDETPDETRRLNEHMQHESGGRNIMNQWAMNNPQGYFNEGHTDSGYWQDVNNTWMTAAKLAGIDTNQFPTARSADYWTQRKANLALLRAAGDSPWGGGRGSQPGGTAGGGRDNLVPQRYLPSQQIPGLANREPGMWGREPEGGYGGIGQLPRTIPDFINIMTRLAQMGSMLSGRSAFGQAYANQQFNGLVQGMQQGQEFQTRLHAEQYQQAMTEFRDRIAEENMEIGSIVAAESANPEQMNRDLAEVANRNNDRVLMAAIQNGPDAIQKLMQARDHLGSDASRASAAWEKEQDARQQQQMVKDTVAADMRKWDAEHPNATPDERQVALFEATQQRQHEAVTKGAAGAGKRDVGDFTWTNPDGTPGKGYVENVPGKGLVDQNGNPIPQKAGTFPTKISAASAATQPSGTDTARVTDWPGMAQGDPPPGVSNDAWTLAQNWAQTGKTPVGLGRQSGLLRDVVHALPYALHAQGKSPTDMPKAAIDYQTEQASATATERYFSSGMGARQMVSLNTVADHIALFRQYAAALKTGKAQLINQAQQALATAVGSPEVIDYALAGRITGDEVVRLLTTSGGTITDREDIAKRLAAYNSPAQFEGAANTLANYVRGRYEPLRQQYVNRLGADDAERKRYDDEFSRKMTPEARKLFEGPQQPIPGSTQQPSTTQQQGSLPDWGKSTATGPDGRKIILGTDGHWYNPDHTPVGQ